MARLWIPTALLATVLVAERTVARAKSTHEVVPTPRTPVSSFIMTIGGDGGAVAVGEASYRRGPGGTQFSLELGNQSGEGAVLFATEGPGPLTPGRYSVNDQPGRGAIHALVFTGTPSAPTGVYRAQTGTLTMRAAADGQIEGSFELRALGFTADRPQQEHEMITVAGSFTATER